MLVIVGERLACRARTTKTTASLAGDELVEVQKYAGDSCPGGYRDGFAALNLSAARGEQADVVLKDSLELFTDVRHFELTTPGAAITQNSLSARRPSAG